MNIRYFMRPCWVVLIVSVVLVPLGYAGGKFTPSLFRLFGISYSKLGPEDLLVLLSALMWFVGNIGMAVASIWCLTDAIVLFVRSHRSKQVEHG